MESMRLSISVVSYILSRTVWKISQIIIQIFAIDRECLSLTHLLWWTPKFGIAKFGTERCL